MQFTGVQIVKVKHEQSDITGKLQTVITLVCQSDCDDAEWRARSVSSDGRSDMSVTFDE